MNIVIAGSGRVGLALARGWRRTGHGVTFATRAPVGVEAAGLEKEGFGVVPLDGAAARAADVVVLAVPWSAVAATLQALGPLGGRILVDPTDALTPDMELAIGHHDSAGETVARLAPDARVVKAFSTTGAGNMADPAYGGGRLMMAVAGDDAAAKQTVMRLAAELGFEPVDTGPLVMSRYLEPLAMVWIKLAYAQQLGPDIGFALLRR